MEHSIQIRFIEKEELLANADIFLLLNPKLSLETIKQRIESLYSEPGNYNAVGVFLNENLIGVTGIWILHKIYVGKHLEMDNVVIKEDYRSLGIGKYLEEFTENFAREINCEAIELNAYVNNAKGHKFWFSRGYQILGFHFQKKLK